MQVLHAPPAPPENDEAQTTAATVLGPKDHRTGNAAILAHRPEDSKRFATLAARYALAGQALIKSQPGDGTAPFYATRWGLIRPLDSLDDAEAFLRRTTGGAA